MASCLNEEMQKGKKKMENTGPEKKKEEKSKENNNRQNAWIYKEKTAWVKAELKLNLEKIARR